jgi:hypothetical protein
MKNYSDTIGNRTRDLPACNLKQLLLRVPKFEDDTSKNKTETLLLKIT